MVRETRHWYMTRTVVLSNMVVQLLSVRALAYIRDMDVRDGKVCSWQAVVSSLGRERIP